MQLLETLDRSERLSQVSREHRLRQIPKESGPILTLLMLLSPKGLALEIGTSGGYSSLWQLIALKQTGRKLVTFERRAEMIKLARKTFNETGANSYIELIHGDAMEHLRRLECNSVAWCFLDAEESDFECFGLVAEALVDRGLIVIDNALTHKEEISKIAEAAESIFGFDTFILNVGNGLLVCLKNRN